MPRSSVPLLAPTVLLTVLLTALLTVAAVPLAPAHADGTAASVGLSKDRAYYASGQRETITASYAGAGSGSAIVFTVLFPNGTTKTIPGCVSDIEDSGTYACGFTGYVNHQVRADVYDSSKTIIATDTISVSETASLSTAPRSGFLGYSGAYAVYARHARPVFRTYDSTGKVAPRCLRHEVQRRYARHWKRVFTSACRAETKSHVDWKWRHRHPSKVRFRVRATFAGDAWNRPGHSSWKYFRLR